MAEKKSAEETKQELSELLAWERQAIEAKVDRLREKLDVKYQVKSFVAKNPKVVGGVALVAGVLVVRALTRSHDGDRSERREAASKRRGKLGLLMGGLLAVAKPAIQKFVVDQTRKEIQRRLHHPGLRASDERGDWRGD